MQRYVLTERGKFLIAIFIIVFFLLLPALIFIIRTLSRDSNEPPHNSNGIYQNGEETDDPDDIQGNLPEPTLEPTGEGDDSQETQDPSLSDLESFDLAAGTMVFLFTPQSQSTLDESTISAIGELMTSPKNTNDAIIAVEIPQLHDNDAAILNNAILEAFNIHGVPLSDIIFFVYQPDPDTQTFKISISFQ